jgi:hypothetical protein
MQSKAQTEKRTSSSPIYTKIDSKLIADLNVSKNYKTLRRKHRSRYL